MKRIAQSLVAFFAIIEAVASAATVGSPFAMCSLLEARLAAGDGVTLPDADRELVRFAGTIDVSEDGWPAEFLARAGQTICVAVSPATGRYEFFDESGAAFWTVVPVLPTTDNWVAPFRHAEEGAFPDDDLYAPWRLVDVGLLSHAGVEFFWTNTIRTMTNPYYFAPEKDSILTKSIWEQAVSAPGVNVFFVDHITQNNQTTVAFSLILPNPADFGWIIGVVIPQDVTPDTLAHELGHACGLDDIYWNDRNNPFLIPTQLLQPATTVLSSEDQTGATSYYGPVLKGSQLIRRLLMNGDDDHGVDAIDIPLGSVKGVDRTNAIRFLSTGVSSVCREPHSYGNDYPPRQAP